MKRILSIDGGGIKGVFPAAFLAKLEEEIDGEIWEYFDLITGTSTGGIIAIGLSLGVSASEISDLYQEKGPAIFSQQQSIVPLFVRKALRKVKWITWGPKYSSENLKKALSPILEERTLGEARTRLLIPAFHGRTQQVYIFKTAHASRLTTDYKELAIDAAMATAAAPTYFEQHLTQSDVGLVDGGLWANNPSGVAVAEGIGTLGWNPKEIRLLSISCLDDIGEMRGSTGAARFARHMAGFFMAGQSHGSLGIAHVLTGDVGGSDHKAVYRVTQSVQANQYALDDASQIPALKDRAIFEARAQKPKLLKTFFSTKADPFEPIHKD